MNHHRIIRLYRLLGLLTALAVIATALVAIVFSLRLNASGDAPGYSVESVKPALRYVGLTALLAALLAIAAAFLRHRAGLMQPNRRAENKSAAAVKPCRINMVWPSAEEDGRKNTKRIRTVRALLMAAALGLIVYGIFNGSMNDVLKKAIAICTECIGLG